MTSIIKVDTLQKANGATPTAADLGINTTGTVLQVVSGSTSSETANSSTNTYADMGLALSITPTSSTSKILVMTSQAGNTVGDPDKVSVRLMRNTTELYECMQQVTAGLGDNDHRAITYDISYVDSPSTTSSVTYKPQFKKEASGGRLDVQKDGNNGHITLIEIAG
jgi:hypothetical protein